jgi:lysophospholipase L1-like esterase
MDLKTKYMFRFLLFITLISFQLSGKSQSNFRIADTAKRIVFLGNSITYSGQYVAYTEAYLKLKHPDKRYEFINIGLPSETVSGLSEEGHADGKFPRPDLHERLQRVLDQTKPDLVFACYGMNDGIYLPFSDERFQKYRDGILWLHNEITKTGAAIVHVTPPIFDNRKGEAYANVLDIYSDWLISCRYTNTWNVIDLHWPMKKFLEDKRLADSTFVLAKDGVHPAETGHWLMAKAVLLYLEEKDVQNAPDILTAVSFHKNGKRILELVMERSSIMKDAWLTSIGHKRPGMKTGLPLQEAMKKTDEIEIQIKQLLDQLY